MKENENRFNYFEKIFLRISLGLVGSGIIIFFLLLAFVDSISDNTGPISVVIVFLLFASFASFLIAIIRIIKYIFVVSKRNDGSRILRSIISFFTSPIAIIIYYLAFFILAISSCEIQ